MLTLRRMVRDLGGIVTVIGLMLLVTFLPPDTSLEEVEANGAIRACVPTRYPPLVTGDPDRPGIDIELLRAVADYLGVRLLLSPNDAMGRDFNTACQRMDRALREFRIRGVKTNIPFLENVIADETFRAGQAHTKLIEDKANGPAIISELKGEFAGIVPVTPRGSKTARAMAVQGLVEGGNVYLPMHADWVEPFIDEHASFPFGANDDQVDAMTQYLERSSVSTMDFLKKMTAGMR